MRKSLLPEKYHHYVYIFALTLLVIGMPLSKFLMSLSQLILFFNWLLEGRLREKFRSFFKNKPALIVSSVLILHLIGLLYTTDFDYAFKDIRIKAPLLVLPLILSTSKPLTKKVFDTILQFFIAAIIIGTAISTMILLDIIHREIVDIRSISIFISHIRFALLICVAIFISMYFIYNGLKLLNRILWGVIISWLISFLMIMESITGLAAFCLVLFVLLLYYIFSSKRKSLQLGAFLALIIGGTSLFFFLKGISDGDLKKENIDFSKLETNTAHGHLYKHEINSKLTENGHYIWIYVCPEELEQSWNQRSALKFSEKDLKGNDIRYTLTRFLASKGLRKDADAVNSLSIEEIKAIERGVPNVNFQNVSSLKGRLHEIGWELDLYKKTGDSNGHSLTQRFEYWKAAWGIIKENLLFGVGTGDIANSFEHQYDKMNSSLLKEWRLRSHNQYLSITVAFGIIGLIWFLITLFYPMILKRKMFDFLYITFFLIAVISFFTEDTLETQAGVTFYAFFNSFFLFVKKDESVVTSNQKNE